MFPQSFQPGFSLSSRIFAIVMVDLRQADAEENKSNRQDDNAHHGIGQSNVSISVAGKQRGLVGKRSGIYYNIIDLLKGKEESTKPSYLLVENVKNLLSINAGFDFASVLSEMDEAGYDCRWQVLNSKNFGVPQNRERVFIIANLRSRGRREILPLTGENAAALNQLIGLSLIHI